MFKAFLLTKCVKKMFFNIFFFRIHRFSYSTVFDLIIESPIIDSSTTNVFFEKTETKCAWTKIFGVIIDSGFSGKFRNLFF